MYDQKATALLPPDPSMRPPTVPQTKKVTIEPDRLVLAFRLGTLTALIAVAITMMSLLASAISPAEATTATTVEQHITVEPLGQDIQTLAQSVIPDPPDLSPSTTESLTRAVNLVIKPAVLGDYGSALTNLESLQAVLHDATAGRTGTHVAHSRALIIQHGIDTVRTDLQSLLEGNAEAG